MEGPLPDEEETPRRPRVVDKRVSSRAETPSARRPEHERTMPPPREETPPAETPPPPSGPEQLWTPEQEEQARRFAEEVRNTPSRDWVLNTAVTLANVAATKLDAGLREDAQVAIDALAAVVDAVGPRLGDAESPLRQTVAQLQMAYAQGAPPPGGS